MSNYCSISASDALKDVEDGNEVSRRTISEELQAHDQTFPKRVRFLNCDFDKEIDFSRCRFEKGVEFVGCVFKQTVRFEAAWVNVECGFRACWFEDEARFDRLIVNGKFEVRAPRDKSELENNWNGRLPGPYVTFDKDTRFLQMRVAGEANFGSVQFKGEADFYNARIEGPAFFRKDYCKGYDNAQKKLDKDITEGRIQKDSKDEEERKRLIESKWFPDRDFRKAHFGERARFRDAYVGSELNFHAAKFEKEADFSYIRVQGVAFFCNPERNRKNISCEFKDRLSFEGARFSASIEFVEASFAGEVTFLDCGIAESLLFDGTIPSTLTLTGCTYKRIKCDYEQLRTILKGKSDGKVALANIIKKAKLKKVKSELVEESDGVWVIKAQGNTIFRFTKANTEDWKCYLLSNDKKALESFGLNVGNWIRSDPSGYTYGGKPEGLPGELNSALGVAAGLQRTLRRKPNGPGRKFDRSSWIQLETALRREGDSEGGDETYLDKMHQERRTLRGYRWFFSWMWDFASDYGTSQWQLAFACVFVLVTGMLVYRYFGYLEPTRDALRSVSCKKTYGTAFGVSLFQFVPVSLPVGDQCKPSGWVEWIAFVQRMLGWVLVPLLAASLAGILHRKADSSPRAESIED